MALREDRDCTTYSDYCEGCNCLALPVGASPPACTGNQVQCFVDPCMNKRAVCNGGSCALE
jgi:hypothetical protein